MVQVVVRVMVSWSCWLVSHIKGSVEVQYIVSYHQGVAPTVYLWQFACVSLTLRLLPLVSSICQRENNAGEKIINY